MTRLLILDCDGVLVDSERLSARTSAALMTELGVPMDEDEALDLFTGYTSDEGRSRVAQRYGVALPDDYAQRHHERLAALFSRELRPVDGVPETLAGLALPFCVASNSSHSRLAVTFAAAGMADLVRGKVYSAEDVSRGKPWPDLFLHAAGRHGIEPEDCLVVDDSPTGIQAAVRAGMPCVGFAGGSHAAPDLPARLLAAGADAVIADFPRILLHAGLGVHEH